MDANQFIFGNETYAIIGAAMEVHNTLGFGFIESVYQEAMEVELTKRNIPFIAQHKIQIHYKDVLLNQFFKADLFCYNKIIVELKAVSNILPEHEAQIINYVRATGTKLGLLLILERTVSTLNDSRTSINPYQSAALAAKSLDSKKCICKICS